LFDLKFHFVIRREIQNHTSSKQDNQ